METSECGAPEFFANGTKVLLLPGADGKLALAGIERAVHQRTDIHYPKTARGEPDAGDGAWARYIRWTSCGRSARRARRCHLRVHMDGARFANAVAALGVAPREITWEAGVDVLCFGGSKNGIALGEAVVFFNLELARVSLTTAASKGATKPKNALPPAPWVGMLQDGAWLRYAQHANAMARRLEAAIRPLPRVEIAHPVQTNTVFARLPDEDPRNVSARLEVLHARRLSRYHFPRSQTSDVPRP